MTVPRLELVSAVRQRIDSKRLAISALPRHHTPLTGYMENIGWPGLFGFCMDEYFARPDFAIEQFLRQQIWWADNVLDDTLPTLDVPADVGMYWDMTLFGQQVVHDRNGVPHFPAHPFRDSPDLALLGKFDFYYSGVMPLLIEKYERMQKLNTRDYAGQLRIVFPRFQRGPLDIFVQMRGYEQFLGDIDERRAFLRSALNYLVDERLRFARARADYLGEPLPATTFVADDWVNLPFITPTFFRNIIVPVYAHLQQHEGLVNGFHTCGRMEGVIADLLGVFPALDWLDVSGWNDIDRLDTLVDPYIRFHVSIINTISLGNDEAEQCALLQQIREIALRRPVSVCAQAIVRLYPTYGETFARLNSFLHRAHDVLDE